LEIYEAAVTSTVDIHAPTTARERKVHQGELWYDDDIHHARQLRRSNEKKWRQTKLEIHRQIFVHHRLQVNTMILKAKQSYYETKLSTGDQKVCFQVITSMLDSCGSPQPDTTNTESLSEEFTTFFSDKITRIHKQIQEQLDDIGISARVESPTAFIGTKLNQLGTTTPEELSRIVRQCPNKTCSLDPLPTELLKKTLRVHLPYLVSLVNNSFREGLFPRSLRTAIVKPIIKKEGLDVNQLKNYRPVSNIPFIAKLLEKVAV
jgi:hypothetical protein